MEIGRKIYFEKTNGVVVWDKGEMAGDVVETTLEEDKTTIPLLTILDSKDQLGVIQLAYGENRESFKSCRGYYINVTDNSIVFL